MKVLRKIMVILFGMLIVLMSKKVNAASSSTVFKGEAIEIEKLESVEITSNDIKIDIDKSEVSNEYLIKNTEDSELVTKITAKLEDEKSNFTIKDLVIKVNNLEIKNIEKEQDNYSFYVKIKPGEYEKIEVNYNTENDLKNAKVIKYSLDSFKDKKVKKFNFDVIIPEEDVPLVKKIYPECFEYDEDENDINVNYYDFTVNNLTKDFIIEKETYKNLIYGEEEDKGKFEEAVYKNAKDMILNGVDNNFSKYVINYGDMSWFNRRECFSNMIGVEMQYENDKYGEKYVKLPEKLESILEYIVYKQLRRDDTIIIKDAYIFDYKGDYPLTKDIYYKYNFSKLNDNLYDRKICVDYVESEGDKELYVKTMTEYPKIDFVKKDELSILKQRVECYGEPEELKNYNEKMKKSCFRIINLGLNINNEQIEATDREKSEYANMINADMYIRKVIYDGYIEVSGTKYDIPGGISIPKNVSEIIAYYSDQNRQTAIGYNSQSKNENEIKKFDNEEVAEFSKVPTVVDSVAFRTTENGKYIITYFQGFQREKRQLGDVYQALKTQSAKTLIETNNEKNENTKKTIEEEIKSAKINDDEEEFDINKKDTIISDTPVEEIVEEVEKKFNLNKNEIIIIAVLGIAILINIIVIMKNKGRRKNG